MAKKPLKKLVKKVAKKSSKKNVKKQSKKPGLKNIKAVLFDLDGVLVNMPDGHYESLNQALSLFGAVIEREEHHALFNGLPTRKKLELLEESGRLPLGLREVINNIKQKYTKEVIPKYCTPDYSKCILLRHLKNKGLSLACCSNSIKETIHLMLSSAQIIEHFDVIIGNDEVTQPKPDPEMYLTAMKRLNVEPHECIIVEDSHHGIAAARASGAVVYVVRNTGDVHMGLFEDLLGFK
jgi:HAD superfamily hydrolase (TIGR01509 family)